jgi:(p)ppGpp synthase/HD superfamily hydrolase
VDFAYAVHSNVGDHCSKAEVNGKIVPLDYVLKSGDIISIVMQKNALPARGWLGFVKTSKARSKIKAALNIRTEESKQAEASEEQENVVSFVQVAGKQRPVKLSKCCSPAYGTPILAFTTAEGKVTIHRKDCPNIHALGQAKAVAASWKERDDQDAVKLRVTVNDRVGMLAEILNVISRSKTNVQSVYTRSKKGRVTITFKMKLPDDVDLNMLIAQIRSLKDVIDVRK